MRPAGRTGILVILLSIVLGLVGLVSGLAGIYSSVSDPRLARLVLGGLAAAVLVVGITCYLLLSPVLVRNWRGVSMLRAISESGLVDVENREYKSNALAPSEVYDNAKREIVITGITASATFKFYSEIMEEALKKGKRVCILILHPDSSDLEIIQKDVKVNLREEIEVTLSLINERRLGKYPNFEIRFIWSRLPFTAIMIDGDVSFVNGSDGSVAVNEKASTTANPGPRDKGGQIRVQPATISRVPQHKGIVFQFEKKSARSERSGAVSGYEYFAADVRTQWQRGEEYPDLLLAQ